MTYTYVIYSSNHQRVFSCEAPNASEALDAFQKLTGVPNGLVYKFTVIRLEAVKEAA